MLDNENDRKINAGISLSRKTVDMLTEMAKEKGVSKSELVSNAIFSMYEKKVVDKF